MKRYFRILTIFLCLSVCVSALAACNTEAEQQAGSEEKTENSDEDNTLSDTVEQSVQTDELLSDDIGTGDFNEITDEEHGSQELPPIMSSQIHYQFNSAKDLDTYIRTGSKDLKDYTSPPLVQMDLLPDPKIIKAYGYTSIFEYFTFDETAFDMVCATFAFNDAGSGIKYVYDFDNIRVVIQPAESENLLECYQSIKNIVLDDSDVVMYSKDAPKNGLVLRKTANCDVLYEVENGVKKVAYFIVNGNYVRIVSTIRSKAETRLNDYNAFLTDPNTAAFSAFFSENDQVFDKATSNITNIAK